MSYDGWIEFNGSELINHARTVRLARTMGIQTVAIPEAHVEWMYESLNGFGIGPFGEAPFGGGPITPTTYDDITKAPWYDAGYEPSTEFAGIIGLDLSMLDTSTLESTPIEYVTDGGNAGRARNKTLEIPVKVAIIASSDRGAEYGKRWLDRRLRGGSSGSIFCAGSDLRYFRWRGPDAPLAHRRDVRVTRGSTVVEKRARSCSSTWIVTFTLTAADPYEYGEPIPLMEGLGDEVPEGAVEEYGSLALVEQQCPVFDYSPVFDPLFPALVPPPTSPDFLPPNWYVYEGMTYDRYWARIAPVEPSGLVVVPTFKIRTDSPARMVRVSVWPGLYDPDQFCDPLFSAMITYLPPDVDFYIDGEQKAAYIWDGVSAAVRRADSVVFSSDGRPLRWAAFNDHDGFLVTLDTFESSGSEEFEDGDGTIRVEFSLTGRSD